MYIINVILDDISHQFVTNWIFTWIKKHLKKYGKVWFALIIMNALNTIIVKVKTNREWSSKFSVPCSIKVSPLQSAGSSEVKNGSNVRKHYGRHVESSSSSVCVGGGGSILHMYIWARLNIQFKALGYLWTL